MKTIAEIGNDCVGCRSCEQSCPKKCIAIMANNEGFLYPDIDENICIECGVCVKRCPVSKPNDCQRTPIAIYALKEKDKITIFDSASGGASDALVEAILYQDGFAYGAAYDDELNVKHIEVTNEDDRKKLQSSKYVQSDIGKTYSNAKTKLQEGKTVLFTGTPCQIAGLHAFLGKEYDNLYTVDLICHGVPSPKFFKKYIVWQGKQMDGKIIYYNFRSKEKRGWGTQYLVKTKTKTKTKTKSLSLDKYGKHFMAGDCYRECCYQCRYANIHHPADLTIGDFWGVEQCHPEFSSRLGVSTVLVNSEKGERMLGWIKESVDSIPITIEEALLKQGNLKQPTIRSKARDIIYKDIDSVDFISDIEIGLQLKERIKTMIPTSIVRLIKQTFGSKRGGVIHNCTSINNACCTVTEMAVAA